MTHTFLGSRHRRIQLKASVLDLPCRIFAPLALCSLLIAAPCAAEPLDAPAQLSRPAPGAASSPTAPAQEANPTVPVVLTVAGVTPNEAGLRDFIRVKVDNLPTAVKQGQIDPRKFVLYLNNIEMKKLFPMGIDLNRSELIFRVARTEEAREAWAALSGRVNLREPLLPIEVSVGAEGSYPLQTAPGQDFLLRIFNPGWLIVALCLLALLLFFVVLLARSSNLLREPGPGDAWRYSLARVQAVWWFFVITSSFVFIWLVTDQSDSLTGSALVLLGIGTFTALGSALVDGSKDESVKAALKALHSERAKLQAAKDVLDHQSGKADSSQKLLKTEDAVKTTELRQLDEQIREASAKLIRRVPKNFLFDILSDANGLSFHRFQMVVWSVILGVIFLASVWRDLVMPQFSDSLLALMGISAGTYIFFKIPERQA